MQARNAHQVIDAGAREGLPLLRRNRTLIAHHERRDDARIRASRKCVEDALAQSLAHRFHPVRGRVHHAREPFSRTTRPHVPGRAHAALEEPRFIVEPVGIRRTMRALQAHGETPALARFYFGRRGAPIPASPIPPRYGDALRHARLGRQHMLDVQLEAHAALVRLWQARNDADDLDVASFPLQRQCIVEPDLSDAGRPVEASGQRNRRERHLARDPSCCS